ncbi:MAG TPA: FkbM family methyltransferase [Solirubrobacteraceae bacterium]
MARLVYSAGWRMRGYATVPIDGTKLRFADLAGSADEWWAHAARRNEWEAPVLAAFGASTRPGDVVFDIGAWIGPYTLLAATRVGPQGRVVSFEPDPVARALLERNVQLNALENVTILPYALAAQEGTLRLTGGHSVAHLDAEGEHEVQARVLADVIGEVGAAPDVMKVDIEGGELDLDVATLRDVRDLFVEIHEPAFAQRGSDSASWLAQIAGERTVRRLESHPDNYNVWIGPGG